MAVRASSSFGSVGCCPLASREAAHLEEVFVACRRVVVAVRVAAVAARGTMLMRTRVRVAVVVAAVVAARALLVAERVLLTTARAVLVAVRVRLATARTVLVRVAVVI